MIVRPPLDESLKMPENSVFAEVIVKVCVPKRTLPEPDRVIIDAPLDVEAISKIPLVPT